MLGVKIISQFCRGFRSGGRKVRNPGVQGRLSILKEGNPELDALQIEEKELDNYDDDFFKAAEHYEHHQRDIKKVQRKIEFQRIERKFFGDFKKEPNLLTWAEKEQIRFLASSDPAKWTPEKLSLSFPATVYLIKKLLKSQWKPKNIERIKAHDKAVAENWKAFERGELRLSPLVQEHVAKFISRKESEKLPNPADNKLLVFQDAPLPRKELSSGFADIIRSYKNRNEVQNKNTECQAIGDGSLLTTDHKNENDVPQKIKKPKSKKLYTLEALRSEINSSEFKSSEDLRITEVKEETKHITEIKPEQKLMDGVIPVPEKFGEHKNYERKVFADEDEIITKIKIPKEKLNPGSVYKVKDCYYDDQGEFLYRVPGMT